MFIKKLVKPFLGIFIILSFLASCGSNGHNFVSGADVSLLTDDITNEVSFRLDTSLSLGQASIPNLRFNIPHPETGFTVGTIELITTLNGGNRVMLDLDLLSVLDLESTVIESLPNGTALPISGLTRSLKIDIGRGVFLYLATTEEISVVGFSFGVKQFKELSKLVVIGNTLNYFQNFQIDEISGTAGIYSQRDSDKNSGLAIFFDVTNAINPSDLFRGNSEAEGESEGEGEGDDESLIPRAINTIAFKNEIPTKSQRKKIKKHLYKLHKRKTKLIIE